MLKKMLVSVLLIGFLFGLPMPVSVGAQGRNSVYERVAITSTSANALRVAGGIEVADDADVGGDIDIAGALTFGTPLTPAVTARLAATGTASAATFLRGDGAWVAVQEVYWDWTKTYLSTTSKAVWSDSGLGFSITTSATNKVILDLDLPRIQGCELRVTGGSSTLQSLITRPYSEFLLAVSFTSISNLRYGEDIFPSSFPQYRTYNPTPGSISIVPTNISYQVRLVDTPGAGTHAYKVQVREASNSTLCSVNTSGTLSTLTAQVLP